MLFDDEFNFFVGFYFYCLYRVYLVVFCLNGKLLVELLWCVFEMEMCFKGESGDFDVVLVEFISVFLVGDLVL